jgi:hypothetical protein
MTPNGPAIKGGCVTRRIPARRQYPSIQVQGFGGRGRRVWRTFCHHGTNSIEHYECRGTNFIGANLLSRYRIFVGSTGAVSRYKLSRSQKFVMVQDFNCKQMRVSWCNVHYEFVLVAGAKAKSVTNNLPLLSVLVEGDNLQNRVLFFFYPTIFITFCTPLKLPHLSCFFI